MYSFKITIFGLFSIMAQFGCLVSEGIYIYLNPYKLKYVK